MDDCFNKIHNDIQNIISKFKNTNYLHDHQHDGLPLSDAIFCAEDIVRNRKFWLGISDAIQALKERHEEVIVVDAGSGIGILGIFALVLGADKCYFIENNEYSLDVSKNIIKDMGFEKQSTIILGDATNLQLSGKPHLLISETIVSGFGEEDFVKIISNLGPQLHQDSFIIPNQFRIQAESMKGDNHSHTEKFNLTCDDIMTGSAPMIDIENDIDKIVFKMDTEIHNDIWVKSGECMSFTNPREFDIQDDHPFFVINR